MSADFIPLDGWGHPEPPFHAGELAIQRRVGVEEKMAAHGRRAIRSFMPEQHREFLTQLPFLVAGAADETGQPWASILTGAPGFIATPDDRTVTIAAWPLPGDPLVAGLRPDAAIGLLGIETPTRRRNRVNGNLRGITPSGFAVAVEQSFGNCPKYIQARQPEPMPVRAASSPPRIGTGLDATDRALVAAADTFFIATAHLDPAAGRAGGIDVSHRGGKPGFVLVEGNQLLVPDFTGNFYFNTLGNLALEPRAGLLFADFATGDLLQLAVTGEIVWDGPELARFDGAQRLMRLRVTAAIRRPAALPFRWSTPDYSPALERTGSWIG